MKLSTQVYQGGDRYEVTVGPEGLADRLPLPGERLELGAMGWVEVVVAEDVTAAAASWLVPGERIYRLEVRSPGPELPNL